MKDIFGILGVLFLMGGLVPYVVAILRRTARPHAFSWCLWALINAIVFAAQWTEQAGAGAWTAGITAVINGGIAVYAWLYSGIKITRFDWAIFILALSAIPLWIATHDPLWSVILVSIIDSVAFLPTLRKSWHHPASEVLMTFVLGGIGFACAIAAMENYKITNWLYPGVVLMTNTIFIAVLLYRRHVLKAIHRNGLS
jgi:hypothetical protein